MTSMTEHDDNNRDIREEHFAAIIDNVVEGIITINSNGIVQYINSAAATIFGYSAEEIVGNNVSMLMPAPYAEAHDGYIRNFLNTGNAKIIGIGREVVGRRKSGREFPMELAVSQTKIGESILFTGIIRDITNRKQAEKELAEQRQTLESVLENTIQAISAWDKRHNLLACNRKFQELIGYPDEMVVPGTSLLDMIQYAAKTGYYGEGPVENLIDARFKKLTSGEPFTAEYESRDGSSWYTACQPGADGGIVVTYTDITERKQAEDKIRYLANHDTLTGLASLRLGKDRLQHAIADARRNKLRIAVLFIDLDGFKAVNDTMGHDAGDAVLKGVAQRLVAAARETDTVVRVGGDEFLIIMGDLKEKSAAEIVAKKLLSVLIKPFDYNGDDAHIGASIGIALFPDNGEDGEVILKKADQAMYQIKKSGKNNFAFVP